MVVDIIIAFAVLRQLHETVITVVVNFIGIHNMRSLRHQVNPRVDDGYNLGCSGCWCAAVRHDRFCVELLEDEGMVQVIITLHRAGLGPDHEAFRRDHI